MSLTWGERVFRGLILLLVLVPAVAYAASSRGHEEGEPVPYGSAADVPADIVERLEIEGGCSLLDAALLASDVENAAAILSSSRVRVSAPAEFGVVGYTCESGASGDSSVVDVVGLTVDAGDGTYPVLIFIRDGYSSDYAADLAQRANDAAAIGAQPVSALISVAEQAVLLPEPNADTGRARAVADQLSSALAASEPLTPEQTATALSLLRRQVQDASHGSSLLFTQDVLEGQS